jgi:methionyl-tRNA formyltransferase
VTDTSTKPKIVFFGSGPVAAASLTQLLEWCEIEAVITKPQPAHHKEQFPVLAICEQHGLTTFTPVGKQAISDLFASKPVISPLALIIDYGFIINQDVIDYFPLGIINSHFSLLPEWRGADPITFSLLSGQAETGVSLMLLVEAMDEGPLLAQTPYAIPDGYTTPQLTRDLIDISDQTLRHIVPLYLNDAVQPTAQDTVAMSGHEQPSYSRKLTKQDGILDFSKPAAQLEREIRAFIEWPKSRTIIGGKDVVITAAHVAERSIGSDHRKPGDMFRTDNDNIAIICSRDVLVVDRLKPAGKNDMDTRSFLAGNTLSQ